MADSGLDTTCSPAGGTGSCRVCDMTTTAENQQGKSPDGNQPGTPAGWITDLPAWIKEVLILAMAVAIGIGGYILEHASNPIDAPAWLDYASLAVFAAAYLLAGGEVLMGALKNILQIGRAHV